MDNRKRTLLVVLAAMFAAVALIVFLVASGGTAQRTPQEQADVVVVQSALLRGVPQEGLVLGDPAAPIEIEEFVDMQCPFCAGYATEKLPAMIEEYVKTGRVKLRLRLLTFLGKDQTVNDSDRAARFVLQAADSGKGWDAALAFFAAQGRENTGYADDAFLRKLAVQIALDPDETINGMDDPSFPSALNADDRRADQVGVRGTPQFFITRSGEKTEEIELLQMTDAEIAKALR